MAASVSSSDEYQKFYEKTNGDEWVNVAFSKNPVPGETKNGATILHAFLPMDKDWSDQKVQFLYRFLADKAVEIKGTVDLAENERNVTPLMMAASTCQKIAVQILLNHKADPNKKDIYNANSIHYTLFSKIDNPQLKKEIILDLIRNGGDQESLKVVPEHPELTEGRDSLTEEQQKIIDEVLAELN
ncbi:MAG: hypothetical protein PVI40_05290 [Chlamydiota bacterium]|jgi:hypothetical protein